MKIAVIERIVNNLEQKPFNKSFYLSSHFQNLFEKYNILWIPIVSEKFPEEICDMCDGLLVTGSSNDVHPKYYHEQVLKRKNLYER